MAGDEWYLEFPEEVHERIAIRDGGKSHDGAQKGIFAHPLLHLFDEFVFRVHDREDVGFPDPSCFPVVRKHGGELVVQEVDRNTVVSGDCFYLLPEEIQPGIDMCIVGFRLLVACEKPRVPWPEDDDGASSHNRALLVSAVLSSI